jgi:hypothetical protein
MKRWSDGMSGRLVAGGTMLVMVLGILWLRASTAWLFQLF